MSLPKKLSSDRVRSSCLLTLIAMVAACNEVSEPLAVGLSSSGESVTPIYDVQGSGNVSSIQSENVLVAGIVTGDFQTGDDDETRNLGGFFLQEEIPDGDVATSDGIFVFDRNTPSADVRVSQRVRVAGTVVERFGETQIVADSVEIIGAGEIVPTQLPLPTGTTLNSDGQAITDLENVEGMLVTLTGPTTINDVFNLARFGELTLAVGPRFRQFTNSTLPSSAGFASHRQQTASRSIILDDGLSVQNPSHYRYLHSATSSGADYNVRSGDTVASAVGNIRFSRGSGAAGKESFRLEPTIDPEFIVVNERNAVAPDVGGLVSVASFNVLNYFTTIDNGRDVCGPAQDSGCRGADSIAELERQRLKIAHTLLRLDADIVGLMELENNGGAALQSLVDELNRQSEDSAWAAIDTGVIGTDAIAVALLYNKARVQPAGQFAILTSMEDSRFNDKKNRPALAQTFDTIENRGRLTVVVNHLKSKGSSCDDIGDSNLSDGQGNCNVTRLNAVNALAAWLKTDPTVSGDPDFLVVGDLNAYSMEDPILALENAGYVNLVKNQIGEDAYSFSFDSQVGALDHAFASVALSERVTGVAEWHINADEPSLLDYNLEFDRDDSIFEVELPFRTSDHDPVIVGVNP